MYSGVHKSETNIVDFKIEFKPDNKQDFRVMKHFIHFIYFAFFSSDFNHLEPTG